MLNIAKVNTQNITSYYYMLSFAIVLILVFIIIVLFMAIFFVQQKIKDQVKTEQFMLGSMVMKSKLQKTEVQSKTSHRLQNHATPLTIYRQQVRPVLKKHQSQQFLADGSSRIASLSKFRPESKTFVEDFSTASSTSYSNTGFLKSEAGLEKSQHGAFQKRSMRKMTIDENLEHGCKKPQRHFSKILNDNNKRRNFDKTPKRLSSLVF